MCTGYISVCFRENNHFFSKPITSQVFMFSQSLHSWRMLGMYPNLPSYRAISSPAPLLFSACSCAASAGAALGLWLWREGCHGPGPQHGSCCLLWKHHAEGCAEHPSTTLGLMLTDRSHTHTHAHIYMGLYIVYKCTIYVHICNTGLQTSSLYSSAIHIHIHVYQRPFWSVVQC